MRLGFDKADFAKLAELWNNFYPPRYRIDAALLRLNTVDSHLFDWGSSAIEVDDLGEPLAFVAVKKSAAALYRGPDPDQAHLTALAYRTASVACDLLGYSRKLLVNRGIYKLVFGQDARHFFPGCPEDCPSLRDFLMVEGFEEGAEQMDLELDLAKYSAPPGALERLAGYPGGPAPMGEGPIVSPIEPEQCEPLRLFLEREFPGRWRYDTMMKISQEGRSDFVYGLWLHGALEGFALTQDATHSVPIGGAVWHCTMGNDWGTLGPIGVSKALRGQGLGDALLAASLAGLQKRGVRQCAIDWTNLHGFYGKHGFEPVRKYRAYSLSLGL